MIDEKIGQELHGEAAKKALATTGLDIMLASILPGELGFFAAHSSSHSILALVVDGATSVWRLGGGTKWERRSVADDVRARLKIATSP